MTKKRMILALLITSLVVLGIMMACAPEEVVVTKEPGTVVQEIIESVAPQGFKCLVDLTIAYDYDTGNEHVTGSFECLP